MVKDAEGNFDTHFVKKYYSREALMANFEEEAKLAAQIALKTYLEEQQLLKVPTREI